MSVNVGILLLSLFFSCSSLKVSVYRDLRFKGLIYEHLTNDEGTPCYNLKSYAQGEAGSIKTDTCLIVFQQPNCQGYSSKLSRDMTEELAHYAKPLYSFHACNATYGGTKIRVDMYKGNELLGEYHDICGCQDMPTQVSTVVNRLNNNGNCITVYSTETCSGSNRTIGAGKNSISENLPQLGYRVRSISGCGRRRQCYQLDAKIFKFRILPDESRAAIMSSQRQVELATRTTFHNNGSATVTQEYEARKSVTESTTFERSTSILMMDSYTVETSATIEAGIEAGPSFVKVSAKVSATVTSAYTQTDSIEKTERSSYTHEETKEFAVKQTIAIPPCAQYEISSMVTMAENYPVRYEMYTRVTGMASGQRMTAEQVSQQVDDLTFVEYQDEYTAVFKSNHRIIANVGVDTFISGEGSDINGCLMREPAAKDKYVSYTYQV